MPNNTATENELAALQLTLAAALETGTDAEVLQCRRAISHFYRNDDMAPLRRASVDEIAGLGIPGLAYLK